MKSLGNPLAKFKLGNKIKANFVGVLPETNDWQYELQHKEHKITAIVKASIVGKTKVPKVGTQQECIILWIDYSQEVLLVSNKTSELERITNDDIIPSNYVGKSGINAKVLLKLQNVFICSLKKGANPLIFAPIRLHFNDFEESSSIAVKEGDFCKLAFIHDKKPYAVLENTWKLWQTLSKKRKALEQQMTKAKKAKLQQKEKEQESESESGESDNDADITPASEEVLQQEIAKLQKHIEQKKQQIPEYAEILQKAQKRKEETQNDLTKSNKKAKIQANIQNENEKETETTTPLFFEDKTPDMLEAAKAAATIKAQKLQQNTQKAEGSTSKAQEKYLPGISNFFATDLNQLNAAKQKEESSDEDDEANNAEGTQQKRKKLTAAEKFKQQREEEARLRAIEEKYADPTQLPETVDQFDRLVLSDPNNSKNWINYMVFHLQSTEIDKARAVARRAIKSISFRDASEQINIWVALLNLELRYGSKQSFDETLKEALTYNEPLKIYLRVLDILCESKKQQELLELIGTLTKKFKAEPEIWKACANAYFSIELSDKAQQLLNRALVCLPERERKCLLIYFI